MARMTHCITAERIPCVLHPAAVGRILTLFALIAGLGLFQLHLRFSLDALRAEEIGLQSREDSLLSEINALDGQTEALKQPERLIGFARAELGMIPYTPDRRVTVRLPEEVTTRYALARASRPTGAAGLTQAGEVWLEALGERLGLVGEAHAAATQ